MVKQNIKQLLIGTNNSGKLTEIRGLLPKRIKTFSTLDFKLKSPKENGKTFEQNSLIKSKYFSKKTGLICLADDSGLEIDILKKKPGIYSARWGGKNGDFKKAIKKVYIELRKKTVRIDVGDAIFFHGLTLHETEPHNQNKTRIALTVGIRNFHHSFSGHQKLQNWRIYNYSTLSKIQSQRSLQQP